METMDVTRVQIYGANVDRNTEKGLHRQTCLDQIGSVIKKVRCQEQSTQRVEGRNRFQKRPRLPSVTSMIDLTPLFEYAAVFDDLVIHDIRVVSTLLN